MRSTPIPSLWISRKLGIRAIISAVTGVTGAATRASASPPAASHRSSGPSRSVNTSSIRPAAGMSGRYRS